MSLVAREDPMLADEARRLAFAWVTDRSAIDPGMVDVVLMLAAQTGDASMFDALRAELARTTDRLDRRSLMMALFSFRDPDLARKGMGLLLDPSLDSREAWTALRNSFGSNPTRRETYRYIVDNFDALAKTVSRDAPGSWPSYASGLCTEQDRVDIERFWAPRVQLYAGTKRELAQTLESIALCTRLRGSENARIALRPR